MMLISTLFLSQTPRSLLPRLLRQARALHAALPADDPDLPRTSARGHLFPEADGIVDGVARAMATEPALFDPERAAALAERQERAVGWLMLQRLFSSLARRAGARHHREQIAATHEALDLLRSAREIARQSGATHNDRRRLLALAAPEALVQRWHARSFSRRRDR